MTTHLTRLIAHLRTGGGGCDGFFCRQLELLHLHAHLVDLILACIGLLLERE